jgi:flagella basal body P-ring formation protein FlgA
MKPIRPLGVFALLLFAASTGAVERVSVPATDVVDAARSALLAKAKDAGLDVSVELVGRVQDIRLPGSGAEFPIVSVERWQGPWLRSRVGVPVQVRVGDKRTATTVWLAVSAPVPGEVYTDAFSRGEPTERLQHRAALVDLAKLQGQHTIDLGSKPGMRLQHAVRAGDPVLASDFESVPMVSARQTVRVGVVRGGVSLSLPARALADGNEGQTIPVLPSNTTRPIRARVVSPGMVTLED